MVRNALMFVVNLLLVLSIVSAQTREEKVRNDKAKVEAGGFWIYNDVPKAFAEAKQSGKPILVVLRCIPCEECVKLDDDIIDADARLKPLLSQFVRVRVVSTNALDLSLFQFDTDQSFAVFLLNADGTVLGRFGTRSHRTVWLDDVSTEGLAAALKSALTLNANLEKNRAALAPKRGPVPEFATPVQIPTFNGRFKSALDYEGKVVQSCIHCHMIGEAVRALAFSRNEKLTEKNLFPYPHPKTLGLILDPSYAARVKSVLPNSDAAKAGFKAGDDIRKLNGQPLVSIADVQWVLNAASPEGAELRAEITRAGKQVALMLKLDSGWRRRDDISWRVSTWGLRRKTLVGMVLKDLPDKERGDLKLTRDATALLIDNVGPNNPNNLAQRAGFQKGDIVVSFDSKTDLLRETDVIAYVLREKKDGDSIPVTILRNGVKQTLAFVLPAG